MPILILPALRIFSGSFALRSASALTEVVGAGEASPPLNELEPQAAESSSVATDVVTSANFVVMRMKR